MGIMAPLTVVVYKTSFSGEKWSKNKAFWCFFSEACRLYEYEHMQGHSKCSGQSGFGRITSVIGILQKIEIL